MSTQERRLFMMHPEPPPPDVAREIGFAGVRQVSDPQLRPVFALYALKGYRGETGDLMAGTPHGDAAAKGYAKGVELREVERKLARWQEEADRRSDNLTQELIDLSVVMARAGGR